MLSREGGDLAAVSANGHGTPAAAVCSGIVIEEEATTGIGAQPQPGTGTLGNQFGRGTSYGCQQPIKTALTRYEFDSPGAILAKQFVVSFSDAQDVVGGLDPFPGYLLFAVHGREDLVQGGAELPGLQKQSLGGLGVGLRQGQELCAAFGGGDARALEEMDELLPGKGERRRARVDEIEAESPAEQVNGRDRHGEPPITGKH
jgi:hypothetical protein